MPRPCILDFEEYGTYWAFKIRPSSQFVKLRTPSWARNVAESVSKDSYITMGQTKAGNWLVQSIKIKKVGKSKEKAKELALRISKKIDGCRR
jgi:hypothetical protein